MHSIRESIRSIRHTIPSSLQRIKISLTESKVHDKKLSNGIHNELSDGYLFAY